MTLEICYKVTFWGGVGSPVCCCPTGRMVAWSGWPGLDARRHGIQLTQTPGTRTGLEMHSGTTLHPTSVGVVRECTHTDMERYI